MAIGIKIFDLFLSQPSDNSTWIVNSTRFEVCDLLPYTKYLIKVAAIPQEGGIWSESRSITASTDKTGMFINNA